MQLRNKNIILRYIIEKDIMDYIKWTTVEIEWQEWDAPWEEDDCDEFVERQRAAVKIIPKSFGKLEIETVTGRHIGWVSSYYIDDNKLKLGVGIDLPSISDRGKGYGENALSLFMAYLFNTEETLYTQTWSGNNSMIQLAKKIGFVEIERNKNSLIVRGEYYDGLTFSITKKNFFGKYVDLLSINESNNRREKMDNVLSWLLEDENPAIRYRTLTELNDKNPADYKECYNKIWEQKHIKRLLSKQDEKGLWDIKGIRDSSPVKNLTTFAEYGLKKDIRLDRYVESVMDYLHMWHTKKIDVFSCYAPIVLRSLVMLDYHGRADVKHLISEFARSQIHDGGFMCKRNLDKKPKRKSCYKAAIDGLLLYAECKRKNILPNNVDDLIEYFLKRNVFYSSDNTRIFIHQEGDVYGFGPIMKIGIPLVMSALSILGVGKHPGLKKAWKMMKEKETENGRFRQEGMAKQEGVFGKEGQENKWSTFYALLAKKYQ